MYKNVHHVRFAYPQRLLAPLTEGQFDRRIADLTQRFGKYFKVRKERGQTALIIFPPGHETYEVWIKN